MSTHLFKVASHILVRVGCREELQRRKKMRRSVFGSLAGEGTFMHLPYVTVVPLQLLFKIILIYNLLIKLNKAREGGMQISHTHLAFLTLLNFFSF